MSISVVVPVYRAEKSLHELTSRLVNALQNITEDFEIIFVEDCGGDASWSIISDLAAADNRIRGIKLSRNFGQHAATICGLSQAKGDWIATLDDDLEQLPEYLPNLYEKAVQCRYDLVYGIYTQRTHKSWRNVTSAIARWLFNKAIPSLNHSYTSFRFIKGDIARELVRFDSAFPFVDGYLSWLTNQCATVNVPHGNRKNGKSNYTLKRLIVHTVNIFVTFSDLPLRIASWVGILCFTFGMGWIGLIILLNLLGGISVSGFTSVMAGVLFFGGVQLLVLGIIGEYLGRMNFKLAKKPLFLIGSSTDKD